MMRGEEPRVGYEIGMRTRVQAPRRQVRELTRPAEAERTNRFHLPRG